MCGEDCLFLIFTFAFILIKKSFPVFLLLSKHGIKRQSIRFITNFGKISQSIFYICYIKDSSWMFIHTHTQEKQYNEFFHTCLCLKDGMKKIFLRMKCFGSNSNEKGLQKRCHNQIRNVKVSNGNDMLQISIGIVDLEM
jgi:uncharacterized membrane protein